MSSEKPKSGKLKRTSNKGESEVPKPNGKDSSSAEGRFSLAMSSPEVPVTGSASPDAIAAMGRRKTVTSFKESTGADLAGAKDAPLSGRETASPLPNLGSGKLASRSSVRLMIDPKDSKDSKHKDKDSKDKKKKDKEHKDKEHKDKEHKDKEKDKEHKDKEHKDKEKEKDKDGGTKASSGSLEGEVEPKKSPRKPKRSASVASIKKGSIHRDASSVTLVDTPIAIASPKVLRMDDIPVYRSSEEGNNTTTSSESTEGAEDSILIAPRLPSSPNGMASPLKQSSDQPNKRHSEVTRRKSARTLNAKSRVSKPSSSTTSPKPLHFPAPRNRTITGELLQHSLTSEGYWAESFNGNPIPPHIDDLFAIQDERRDALLFPLQNFNNHYEYHALFQLVPHVNFIGFDNSLGPVLISITQEAYIGDSITSPRQNSKSNLMQRQVSEKSIKGGKIKGSSDSVSDLAYTPTSSSMAFLGGPLTPRTESQRNLKSGMGEKSMDRQMSSSAIHTMMNTEMLGSHRALIRTKIGDIVAKIPAMNTKRKYPKGHTLMNALIASAPNVPFDWEKVEFKEATFTKESVVSMELRLVPKHYKFGVIFARGGQLTDDEFLNNSEGSEAFDKFMSTIAKKIELKSWPGYPGGLDVTHGQTGKYSYFTKFRDYDIMFHVSTLLPHVPGDEQQLEKKRHIGNDVVVIVFQEDDTPIAPETIKSYFNHVFIIVHPIQPEEPASSSSGGIAGSSAAPTSDSADSTSSMGVVPSIDLVSSSEFVVPGVPGIRSDGRIQSPTHFRFSSETGPVLQSTLEGQEERGNERERSRTEIGGAHLNSEGDDFLAHGGDRIGRHAHSPSSPMLLQRLGEQVGNLSPSRRSPIFSRTPRSTSSASPPSSPHTQATVLRSIGGASPRPESPIRRPASPATRIPNLKYNTLSESRTYAEGSVLSLERHSDDSLDSPDLARHLRSPRVLDSSDDDLPGLAFMDPVSLAAMPSGGQLAPDWMVQNVVMSPREATPDGFADPADSTLVPSEVIVTSSPSATGEFNLQSIDPATGEDIKIPAHSSGHGSIGASGSSSSNGNGSPASFLVTSSAPPAIVGASAAFLEAHERRDSDDSNSSAPSAAGSSDLPPDEHEDTVKRRLSRRLSTGIGNKQLVKSTKGRQLSKALPQIARAKLNVAAKERQAHPPVQFRIEVVSKDGVVPCDPKLPPSPIFAAGPYFREFILTKLVNAERAAYFSQHFAKPIERTRELLFKELLEANK